MPKLLSRSTKEAAQVPILFAPEDENFPVAGERHREIKPTNF